MESNFKNDCINCGYLSDNGIVVKCDSKAETEAICERLNTFYS